MTDAPPPKVSKALANAVYDDFKRKAIDAAKKRAVAQGVDYDTFCAMVSVAHLRPLAAEGSVAPATRADTGWRFAADGRIVKASDPHYVAMAVTPPTEPPASSGDFAREWRRNLPSPDQKYAYLKLCGAVHLGEIFRVEVPGEVLGEILAALNTCWLSAAAMPEEGQEVVLEEARFVVDVLSNLASTGRFSLTVRLVPAKVKGHLESLFESLREVAVVFASSEEASGVLSSDSVVALGTKYGVKSK